MQTPNETPDISDDTCPNCGATVDGKFCSSCGQKRIDKHEFAVKHFFGHLVHEITHLDGNKITKTFVALIAKPGLLTCEYLAGRKGQYLTPIRIYLTVSALYFLFAWGALANAGGGSVEENQNRPFWLNLPAAKASMFRSSLSKFRKRPANTLPHSASPASCSRAYS